MTRHRCTRGSAATLGFLVSALLSVVGCAPVPGSGSIPLDAARTPEPNRPAAPLVVAERQDYRILLDPADRVVNIVLPLERYESLRTSDFLRGQAREVSGILYDHFEDAFDFVFVTFDERQPWEGGRLSGRAFRTRVVAEGLGLGRVSHSSGFGSDGRLASILFLRAPSALRGGPSLHEMLHTWGQAVLPTDYAGHWGRSSVFGQLGGWKRGELRRGSDGVYEPPGNRSNSPLMALGRLGGNAQAFADLELYLMGLIPADSVGEIEVAVGAEAVPGRGAAFTAEAMDVYTMDRIIEEHGPRVPAWPEAQRDFRAVFVILSALPLGRSDWTTWSEHVRDFATPGPDGVANLLNFWEATGGRATLRMDGLGEVLRGDPPPATPNPTPDHPQAGA